MVEARGKSCRHRQITIAKMVKSTIPAGICCSATNMRSPPAPTSPGCGVSSQTAPIASANGTTSTQTKKKT